MKTVYQIQQIAMDEFASDEFGDATMTVFAETEDQDDALRMWASYCSGVCDEEGAFDGQNYGRAYFYRIVERTVY